MTMSAVIHMLLIITVGIVPIDGQNAGTFRIEAGTRRTDTEHESVPIVPPGGSERLACVMLCFKRHWCRAANVNLLEKLCDLFNEQVDVNDPTKLATDNSSFIYFEIHQGKPKFPLVQPLPKGFPTGSRVSVKFRAAWYPLELTIIFTQMGVAYHPLQIGIDQLNNTFNRMSWPGVYPGEVHGGFPFDAENVWEMEIVKANMSAFEINVNGAPFTTYNTPLNASVIDHMLIFGAVSRYPYEVVIEEAALSL